MYRKVFYSSRGFYTGLILAAISIMILGQGSLSQAIPINPGSFSTQAVTVNFDTYPNGVSITGLTLPPFFGPITNTNAIIDYGYASLGIIFLSNGTGVVAIGQDTTGQFTAISTPNVIIGTIDANTYSTGGPIYIHFVDPTTGLPIAFTTMVGIYAKDVDTQPVPFIAYDLNGVELGRTYFPVGLNGSTSFAGLTFGGTPIGKVAINDPQVDTIALDNLRFEPVGIIPESNSLALLGVGLVGLGRLLRKRNPNVHPRDGHWVM